MKGKRLPELVAGELEDVLLRLGNRGHERLLANVKIHVSSEEWDDILEAFDSARAHVQSALHVKFDFLRRLPWSLAALAHHDTAVARRHALRMIQEFDHTPDHVAIHHHAKTLLFLDRQGPLLAALAAFAGGGELSENPAFHFHVATFRYVNIVERFIKGRHAVIKRSSGRSGSAVSLSFRLAELEEDLRRDPSFLSRLVELFGEAKRVSRLPGLLGFANHPVFQMTSPHQMHHGAVVKHLRKILYRADIIGLLPDVRAAAKHHSRELGGRKSRAALAVQGALGNQEPITEDRVLRSLLVEHVRTFEAESLGAIFSLPIAASGEMCGTVAGAMQPKFTPPAEAAAGAECGTIGSDVHDQVATDLLVEGPPDGGGCGALAVRHGADGVVVENMFSEL